MSWSNYIVTCLIVAALTAVVILFVPGVAESLESELLTFLGTNARG